MKYMNVSGTYKNDGEANIAFRSLIDYLSEHGITTDFNNVRSNTLESGTERDIFDLYENEELSGSLIRSRYYFETGSVELEVYYSLKNPNRKRERRIVTEEPEQHPHINKTYSNKQAAMRAFDMYIKSFEDNDIMVLPHYGPPNRVSDGGTEYFSHNLVRDGRIVGEIQRSEYTHETGGVELQVYYSMFE